MTLTLAQYKAHVKVALGGEPAVILTNADTTKAMYVNDAGRALCNAHPWNWLMRPPTTLNLTADTEYVALPTDFGAMVSLQHASLSRLIRQTTPDYINGLRGNQISWDGLFWAAVHQPGQADATHAPPPPRLELYPTPSASETGAIRLTYRAGWTDLANSDANIPNLPGFMEPLFVAWLRAYVRDLEEDSNGARLLEVQAGPLFAAAVAQDGTTQSDFGPPEGGAAMECFDATTPAWAYGALADPS